MPASRGRRAIVVALLDDDDIWLPGKTRHATRRPRDGRHPGRRPRPSRHGRGQLHLAATAAAGGRADLRLLVPQNVARHGRGFGPNVDMAGTDGLVSPHPFDESLRRYVDLDWLLRAADEVEGFTLRFAGWPDPLCVWDIRPRPRVSTRHDGLDALAFADERRHLMSPDAYAGFVLTLCSDAAVRGGRTPGFWRLLNVARRNGRPNSRG